MPSCQSPVRSACPSGARGAGAARFGLPLAVRGMPGVGWLSHCACADVETSVRPSMTAMPNRCIVRAYRIIAASMRGASPLLIALLVAARTAAAQPQVTPVAGDAARGSALFQLRCADCHGVDAKGVHGPDLTVLFANGATEDRVAGTIRRGVPGTEMPSSNAPEEEIRAIVAFLRTFVTAPSQTARGDAASGERLFSATCASCHRVNGRGGVLGPDLSRIGAGRSRELLTREIRDASAAITPGYQPVTLVLKDGQRVRGTRKNEDAYSIQIMDMRQRLQGYIKADLREVINEKASLMPDFKADRLSDNDLKVGTTTEIITTKDLLDGFKNPSRWAMYSGDYTGTRHSPLTQITSQNVSRLTPQWAFQADTIATGRGFESTPLVIDGVIYLTGANGNAWAIDARTGRQFWRFRYPNAPDLTAGATYPVNRGFAALGNQLFMVTLDAHVLSLDMRTGAMLWSSAIEDYKAGYPPTP